MSTTDRLVKEARQHIGKPYVHATAGPNTFDCSGFVHYVVKKVTGDTISRSSADYVKIGKPIFSLSACLPGDILCYYVDTSRPKGTPSHVGIYAGNGKMVNALNQSVGVVENNVTSSYWTTRFLFGRRLYDAVEPVPVPDAGTYNVDDEIKVSAGPLNVRSGPNVSYSIVDTIPVETRLCVTGSAITGGDYIWIPVRFGDKQGWVAQIFTSLVDREGCTPDWTHEVNVRALNMREGPSTSFRIIATLPHKTRLRTITTSPAVDADGYKWYSVDVEKYGKGWCIDAFNEI